MVTNSIGVKKGENKEKENERRISNKNNNIIITNSPLHHFEQTYTQKKNKCIHKDC